LKVNEGHSDNSHIATAELGIAILDEDLTIPRKFPSFGGMTLSPSQGKPTPRGTPSRAGAPARTQSFFPSAMPYGPGRAHEFVLSLKTARTGIDVPMAFSAATDEVIE
jgi:hypothetical protein